MLRFFLIRFGIFFIFLSWYHLPYSCNNLELERVILQFLLNIEMFTHFGMLTFPFARYLLYYVALQPLMLHSICLILVLQTVMLHGFCDILVLEPFTLHGF